LKVNNFSELDNVLKKSFFKIKDDVNKSKKDLDSRFKDFEKKQKNSIDLVDTKIKFISDEIKKFKNYKNELINEQKNSLKELKDDQKANKELLKEDYKKELEKLTLDITKLKDNFLKVMDILKDNLVTKKSFEENNKIVEKALNDLIEKTKDIEQIKFNYFSKLNVNRQLTNLQTDFKEFKEDYYKTKETLDNLESVKQELGEFKESSNNKFVQEDLFLNKTKEFGELKDSLNELREKVARLLEQNNGSVDIHLFNNEIEDIRKRISLFNEVKEQLSFVNKDQIESQTNDIESLKGKQDLLIDEIKALKDEINSNNELKKDLEKIKAQIEKAEHKIDKNNVMIELIRDTKSTVKIEESEKSEIEAKIDSNLNEKFKAEESFELNDPFAKIESDKPGLFKKTLKGITDFFLEEDGEDVFSFEENKDVKEVYNEALNASKITYQAKQTDNNSIADTKFVAEIEKMFDGQSDAPEINLKLENTEEKNSFLNKIKTGVVNFFFEEVDDDEFVFQGEEIEQEDEVKLEEPEEIPQVEIVEEAQEMLDAKDKAIGEQSKPNKRSKKAKTEYLKSTEEENDEEKKVHYMKSKKPRIFQDLEEESELNADSEVDDLTKIKKKDKKANLAEEDYVYYPEDYFY